jgi:hypothetical protein
VVHEDPFAEEMKQKLHEVNPDVQGERAQPKRGAGREGTGGGGGGGGGGGDPASVDQGQRTVKP